MTKYLENEVEMIDFLRSSELYGKYKVVDYGCRKDGKYFVEYKDVNCPDLQPKSEVHFSNDKFVLKEIDDQVVLIIKGENQKIRQYITIDEDEDNNLSVKYLM